MHIDHLGAAGILAVFPRDFALRVLLGLIPAGDGCLLHDVANDDDASDDVGNGDDASDDVVNDEMMMPMVIHDEGPENDGIQCLIQCLVVLFSWSLVFLLSCCLAREVVRLLHKGFLAMSNSVSGSVLLFVPFPQ